MIENMIGKKYGRLTVLNQYYKTCNNGEKRDWCECLCDCGNPVTVQAFGKNIRRGMTLSCGCLHYEAIIKACKKYNEYDLSGEYGICFASNNKDFKFYFDIEDYEKIKNYCWMVTEWQYAHTKIPVYLKKLFPLKEDNYLLMSDLIVDNYDINMIADHINRERFDNRKSNLRIITNAENCFNKSLSRINTSGIMGVSQRKNGEWHAYLGYHETRVLNKTFKNFRTAVIARLNAEEYYYGELAPQKHLFEEYGIK